MKTIKYITFISISAILILASCKGHDKKADAKSADTTATKIPTVLSQLNTELLSNPNNSDLYYKRAKFYIDNKNYSASLLDITKAMNIDSTKAQYFILLSDIYFFNNQTGNAKRVLEKSIQLDDKNTEAMLKLAELYLYVRKHDKSIEYINMALKIDKYNAKGYFMKGMNYKEMRDTAKAISSMQTAVEQDQTYFNAYIQLGLLCAAQRNPLAAQYYKDALHIQPNSVEAWYDIGKFYQDIGDWNNALTSYNSLLKIDAGNKNAHYNIGVVYFLGDKNYDNAIDQFTQAINIDAKYVAAYYARGVCYRTKGKLKDAVRDFVACTSISPDFAPAKDALKELNNGQPAN